MIIDRILDRYDGDAYDPKEFYNAMMSYEEGTDYKISRAMDSGEEEDIRRELCAYIDDAQYNPKIKDFINSVAWLEPDDGRDYSKEIDILGESKKHICSMAKKKESLAKKNESDNAAIISELETLRDITEANEIKSALRKLGFDIIEYGWLRSSEGPSGGEYTVWKNPNGVYVDLDYSLVKPDPDVDSWVDDEVLSYEYYTDKADYEKYHGYSPRESLKKKESLAKKNEADYGAMTWTVTVEFDDNGKSVRKDYVVKAHNRDSAIDQAKLKPRHTNPDAKDIKVTYCKLGESLAKKSEGFMEDLPYDAPVAIDALCAEIMLHTEEFTIEDAAVAEMCGKWYIRNYADGPTAAHNEEEWVEEVLTGLSGSPVDGSPFGAAEAEEYAHQVFQEELAEE